jgi:tetratricopeptide (TPR) repeat protein
MNRHYFNTKGRISALITEYEEMSQKGMVCFYEESVFMQLIDFYERTQDWHKALNVTNDAITRHAMSANLQLRKAQLLMSQHCLDEAYAALELAQKCAPLNLTIRFVKVDILSLKGKHESALTLLHHMKKNCDNETLADVFVYEAGIFESLRQYRRMFKALCEALTLVPTHEEAAQSMVAAVSHLGNYKDSIAFNEYLLDRDPYLKWAWYHLGFALAEVNRVSDAIEAYEFACALDENFEQAYQDCARLLLDGKQYAAALNYYLHLLSRTTDDIAHTLLQIGICYTHLGDHRKGYAFYLEALEMDPNCWETHFRIGAFHASLGCWKEAIKWYRKAMYREDEREEIYAAMGEAYFQLKKYQKGKEYFAKATEIAPECLEYWLEPAAFLMDSGRTAAAMEILEEAELNIPLTAIQYAKIACLYASGRRAEASYLLGDLLAIDFEPHTTLFRMSPILELDMNIQKIIDLFKK